MRSNNGFTLIEILVVMTITMIVFGVGLSGYRQFSRRQILTGVVKQTQSDLHLVQQFAITGQKPEGVTCTRLSGYTFNVSNVSTYQLIANCTNSNILIKSVAMPDNVTISTGLVTFKVLGQGTYLTSPLVLTLTSTVSGTSEQITIGTNGDIK